MPNDLESIATAVASETINEHTTYRVDVSVDQAGRITLPLPLGGHYLIGHIHGMTGAHVDQVSRVAETHHLLTAAAHAVATA